MKNFHWTYLPKCKCHTWIDICISVVIL